MHLRGILCHTAIVAILALSNQITLAYFQSLSHTSIGYVWRKITPDIQDIFKMFTPDQTAYFIADYTLIKVVNPPMRKDQPIARLHTT